MMADAAAAAGVKVFVFSTLEDVDKRTQASYPWVCLHVQLHLVLRLKARLMTAEPRYVSHALVLCCAISSSCAASFSWAALSRPQKSFASPSRSTT